MDKLKKCPFCGGEAEVKEPYYAGSHHNDIFGYEVECQSCGVRGVDWDTAKEAAADDGFDDYIDDYLSGLTGAQIAELDTLLNNAFKKWEKKHNLQSSFFSVKNIERYTL